MKESTSKWTGTGTTPVLTFTIKKNRSSLYDNLSSADLFRVCEWIDENIRTLQSWRQEIHWQAVALTPQPAPEG